MSDPIDRLRASQLRELIEVYGIRMQSLGLAEAGLNASRGAPAACNRLQYSALIVGLSVGVITCSSTSFPFCPPLLIG